jgi:hypothetical protein
MKDRKSRMDGEMNAGARRRKGKRHTFRKKGDTVLYRFYTIHHTTDRYVITSIIVWEQVQDMRWHSGGCTNGDI